MFDTLNMLRSWQLSILCQRKIKKIRYRLFDVFLIDLSLFAKITILKSKYQRVIKGFNSLLTIYSQYQTKY
jgi:hypothetical protein